MSCRYKCSEFIDPNNGNHTTHSLNGADDRIIRQLTLGDQAHFPTHLTHMSGISTEFAIFIKSGIQNGLRPHKIHHMLNGFHFLRHSQKELVYLDSLERDKQKKEKRTNFFQPRSGGTATSNTAYENFSTFGDKM
jgi:hypothetical protein